MYRTVPLHGTLLNVKSNTKVAVPDPHVALTWVPLTSPPAVTTFAVHASDTHSTTRLQSGEGLPSNFAAPAFDRLKSVSPVQPPLALVFTAFAVLP